MKKLIFIFKILLSMYLAFNCHITIGNVVLKNITALEIRSGVKTMTKTAKLTIPRNLWNKETRIDKVIKKKDSVTIKLGCNGELNEEFVGYVLEVSPGEPLVIRMEDEMMMLKETSITYKWKTATLKQVVAKVAPGYQTKVADINLGNFQIKEATATLVFDKLRSIYGIHTRFVDGVLHSGFPYDFDFKSHTYHFQKNVKNGEGLKFKFAAERKIKIKAIANLNTGKKLVEYAGDENGEIRTRNFGPSTTKADLKKFAMAALEEEKFDGYRGTIKGFGHPYVQPGDTIEMIDKRYPERAQFAANLVDEVTVRVGQWFFERIVKPGKIV